ncbi:PREDICTED: G-type lectin S-receptor-like serine/threonine-protein kinase At4g27290 [Ipomoea nil]|uniref:G-type lectin S-receptor-like serine/threonine-protein kinase At4g27290 n=1 Tax=Ipomoea nil TaxID=35883 RepID=UPI000900E841|nr:PREDICTED: G-type lectin S-receptor-like serine/threonine-protein kinase At4g27290 [Ipomoea nil]
MENNFLVLLSWLLILISLSNTPLSHGAETISGKKYLTQTTTISSLNGRFELGFFRPGESSNYYVGIWYKNITPQTVVWVANRVAPVPSAAITAAKLRILDGNLVIVDGAQNLVWSTNITAAAGVKRSSVVATLGDDGNLVLNDGGSTKPPLWQSFDHPTDTNLAGSKFGYNKRTKTTFGLTAWKSSDDPAPGPYSIFYVPTEILHVWNGREGYGTGLRKFANGSLVAFRPNPVINFTLVDNENETYFTYFLLDQSIIARHIIDIDGREKELTWSETAKKWMHTYVNPETQCDVYAYCGPFGICSDNSVPVCDCLHGFRHRSETEWGISEFFGGCVRNTSLKCGINHQEEDMDRFRAYPNVRLPRHPKNTTAKNQAECESTCLRNCSCTAYAYDDSNGRCSVWAGELLDLKQFGKDDVGNESTIYIRLAASEFPNIKDTSSKHWKLEATIASLAVAATALLACSICYVCYKKRRTTLKITEHGMDDHETLDHEDNDEKSIDVQCFTFQSILEATDNFSDANKLGKGGFGPVYKGVLSGGREIAVKRLSTLSGQGVDEFKNEVVLIAKLQHRNLVNLVGYCMLAKERILIYEYMPNKSLDTFIFNQTRRLLLDWNKRFDIILGIARGLVYLHHDSRLRIIHRDMKTNNILLDEEMAPKISDFGLARMMAGNEFEANTKKIAGTYGYLSPEYALGGLFSIKSDVFSFGVIILEIVSGKKNTAFYRHEDVSNLLGYAWKLWNEGNIMDLVDDSLLKCCKESEVLKCINVGLLCVEEDPNVRPSMPSVLLMLSDESTVLPKPNQPAFVTRKHTSLECGIIIESDKPCSNQLTFSTQEGR